MNTEPTLLHAFKRHTVALALLSAGLAAQATCVNNGTIYLSQSSSNSVPTTLETSAGALPINFIVAGTSANRTYNALGYDPITAKLYGITVNSRLLVEIDAANGATTLVGGTGVVTGLPTNVSYNSGAFSDTGKYYVKPVGNNALLYEIDVTASPPTATPITLSQAFITSDMAWVGSLMYSTADNGQLYSIDVATGATATVGGPDNLGGVLGAQFSGTNGLFGAANNGSGLYRINLATGRRDKISDAPSANSNDGASCPTVALFEPLPTDPNLPVNPPGSSVVAPVPTLDVAGLGLLSLLGAGAGALSLRRRKRGQ